MKLYNNLGISGRDHVAYETCLVVNKISYCIFWSGDGVFFGKDVEYNDVYIENNEYNIDAIRYFGTGGPVIITNNDSLKIGFSRPHIDKTHEEITEYYFEFVKLILKRLNIPECVITNEGNDIFMNGKKISGLSYKRNEFLVNYFFFITLEINFDAADKCMILINHTEDLSERANGINQILGTEINISQLQEKIIEILEEEGAVFEYETNLPENYNDFLKIFNDENWIKYGQSN